MPAIPNAAERRAVGATLFSMDAAPKAQLMGYVVKLGTRSCAGSWIERRWEPPLDTGSRLPSAPKHAQSKAGTFDARPWASYPGIGRPGSWVFLVAVPGPSGRDRTTGTMTTDSTTKSDHDSEFVRATALSRFDPRQITLTEVFA